MGALEAPEDWRGALVWVPRLDSDGALASPSPSEGSCVGASELLCALPGVDALAVVGSAAQVAATQRPVVHWVGASQY